MRRPDKDKRLKEALCLTEMPMLAMSDETIEKALSAKLTQQIAFWADGGEKYASREKIHEEMMKPEYAKDRKIMTNAMRRDTHSKIINGERHFLLHRGTHSTDKSHQESTNSVTYSNPVSTTPEYKMARSFADETYYHHRKTGHGVVHSVWVPESKISLALHHTDKVKLDTSGLFDWKSGGNLASAGEKEVIIAPGNYQKATSDHLKKNDPIQAVFDFNGIQINIEWPKGSTRHYTDGYKKEMLCSYGYIARTDGDDGEEIDVYLGDCLESKRVFLIHQNDSQGGEDKVMLGFATPEDAKVAYLAHMDEKNFDSMREMSLDELKAQIDKRPQNLPKGEEEPNGVKYIVKAENVIASLYIVRHGKTEYNGDGEVEDKIRGWLDILLNEEGRQEAVRTGKTLKNHGITEIYSSDLKRAVETAEEISRQIGAPVVSKEKALRPWNLGDIQGKPTKESLPKIHQLIEDPTQEAPNGESFDTFTKRYLSRVIELMDKVKAERRSIAAVAHYRNLEVAKAWYKGGLKELKINFKDLTSGKDIPTGGIICFNWDGKKWDLEEERIEKTSEPLVKELWGLMPESKNKIRPFHGWISPEGKFYQMQDSDMHDDFLVQHGLPNGENVHETYKKGWISTGHSGRLNVIGHPDVLANPNHPAVQKARQIIANTKHEDFEEVGVTPSVDAGTAINHKIGWNITKEHAVKFGLHKPASELSAFHKTEEEVHAKLAKLRDLMKRAKLEGHHTIPFAVKPGTTQKRSIEDKIRVLNHYLGDLYGKPPIKELTPQEHLKAHGIKKTEDDLVHLEHYSDQQHEIIQPKFHGTGVSGQESKRKNDPNWVDRSYYYDAGTKPEASLAYKPFKHTVSLPKSKIYDLGKDPENFSHNAVDEGGFHSHNVIESRIKQAGYAGYRHSGSAMSNVVAVFDALKPYKVEATPTNIQKIIWDQDDLKKEMWDTTPKLREMMRPFHGWIDPAGKFYQMKDNETHGEFAYNKIFKRPQFSEKTRRRVTDQAINDAHIKGWITVGQAGLPTIQANPEVLHDRDNPATKALAQIIKKMHPSVNTFEVHDYSAAPHNVPRHLAEKGIFKKPSQVAEFHKSDDYENFEHRGWISPGGEFQEIDPDEEHSSKFDSRSHKDLSDQEKETYQNGWISVGHLWGANACVHPGVLNNPHHPAMKTLRSMVGNWPGKKFRIERYGVSENRVSDVNSKHFAAHGTIPEESLVTQFHKTENDFKPTYIGHKYSIITAHNPLFPTKSVGGNQGLEEELKQAGYKYEHTVGMYGGTHEPGFLVHNADPKHIEKLGEKYGQESVIHSEAGKHKMVFTNGPKKGQFHSGAIEQQYMEPPEDNYTTLERNGNKHHFRMEFDFDKLEKADGIFEKLLELKKGIAQRLWPFNPQKDRIDEQEESDLASWQSGKTPDSHDFSFRETIGPMPQAAKERALHKLSGVTKVRRAADGKREFLLHRGMSDEEHKKAVGTTHVKHEDSSSWTPNRREAGVIGGAYGGKRIVSAWIHEDQITSIPKQYGELHPDAYEIAGEETYRPPKGPNVYAHEHEVIVEGGHKSELHKEKENKFRNLQAMISAKKPLSYLPGPSKWLEYYGLKDSFKKTEDDSCE